MAPLGDDTVKRTCIVPPVTVSRLVFSGGGELDKEKTTDLMETLLEPSRMRGNDPNALQNPCRPTVFITDTVCVYLKQKRIHVKQAMLKGIIVPCCW